MRRAIAAGLLLLFAQASAFAGDPAPATTGGGAAIGAIDAARASAADPAEWLLHGRTWDEQRHSPLDQIHRGNVGELGLAWSYRMGTKRGLEATPIVVDGVLYVTGTWSVVHALDAKTGALRWSYDPQVPKWKGRHACCDVVNRGVAVWKGRVYVGTIDGRLVALDAASGDPVWEVRTTPLDEPYTITGAPRVVKDLVVIGNGGAEYGVRGYFTAYDAATGEQRWRFFTVPGSKEGPHEHPELAAAAATWSADSLWESGLGGTAWDAMAYDPELDLLYVGVGNSSVYDRAKRSPGGGDNLFLASILAVRPDSGRLVWHYQTTPGEAWDYTATQHLILADLEIEGVLRKVLMQAPKNGFFYVLDRATGELLSAEKYVHVSWASHVDLATGRPVERPEADWSEEDRLVAPAIFGGHNWQPMAFDPATGLVYIPAIEATYSYFADPGFVYTPGRFNTAEDMKRGAATVEGFEDMRLALCSPSRVLAWDPVKREKVWEVRNGTAVPGGLLATAGGLVFQGNGSGRFLAHDAATGRELWSAPVGVGIMAAPVSYAIDGEQYVAVLAGVGGSLGVHFHELPAANDGRLLVFKLGAKAAMPAVPALPVQKVEAPVLEASPEAIVRGRDAYADWCVMCHGFGVKSGGIHPDLRFASAEVHAQWIDIVLGGTRADKGMASFADALTPEQARDVQAYVISRARHEPGALETAASWLARNVCIPSSWLTD
jgi:PQQ-dependent dehydrogenase (methanol/ethanol family)